MITDYFYKLPWNLISIFAEKHNIDRDLVGAIVMTESAGQPSATRYEPGYRYLYFPRDYARNLVATLATEEAHQKTSWGLMQVMGGLARELGFKSHLPELIRPNLALEYGCKHLKNLHSKYDEEIKIVSAYNAGSARLDKKTGMYENQRYCDKVYRYLRDFRRLK